MKRFWVALLIVFVGAFVAPVANAANNCTGATYYDSNSDTCIACPAGYDYNTDAAKDDITDCQIHCDAGTYHGHYGMTDYTTEDYITDGLILQLDGYTNTRDGNNPNATTWQDLSPSQNDGQFIGTVDYDSTNYGYIFNNNSNYVQTINNLGLSGAVIGTIEIVGTWYGTGSSQINGLFTFGSTSATDGRSLTGAVDRFSSVNAGFTTSTTPATNTPFTMTFISLNGKVSGMQTLLNGVQNGLTTNTTQLNVDATPIQIGRFWVNGYNNRSFNGIIHAVRVYNRVLSNAEIMHNYELDVFRFNSLVTPLSCVNAGSGYYAVASVANYGSVGVRTACPAGTYSNNPNATSINDCIPCIGATYNDEMGMAACKSCPAGYDYNTDPGKTDVTQCQIHCDGGTYSLSSNEYVNDGLILQLDGYTNTRNGNNPNATTWQDLSPSQNDGQFIGTFDYDSTNYGYIFNNNSNYVQTINNLGLSGAVIGTIEIVGTWYGTGSSQINGLFTFGSTSATNGRSLTGAVDRFYSVNAGFTTSTTPATNTPFTMTFISLNGTVSGMRTLLNGVQNGLTTNTTQLNVDATPIQIGRFWVNGYNNRSFNGIIHAVRVYNRVLSNAEIMHNYELDVQRFNMQQKLSLISCIDVGPGYYAPASTANYGSSVVETRTACPAGLTTVGYGHGADELNDCARTLHVGDYVLYARRDKITTPSLNIAVPNEGNYYVSLSPTDHTLSRLHVSFGNSQYTAYDDSLSYGERDFDTGQQITQ